MSRRRRLALAAAGVLLVAAAVWVAVRAATAGVGTGSDPAIQALAWFVTVAGFGWALWWVAGRTDPDDADPATGTAPIRTPTPERTPGGTTLSGQTLARALRVATERAGDERSLSAGLDVVRPSLRATVVEVLVAAGTDREAAEAAVAEGTWTDDATAAAVCSASVAPPVRSLRWRVAAWLAPERVLARLVRATMAEIDAVAAERLPSVAGQAAPKRVRPTHQPLERLERAADGSLRAAGEVDRPEEVTD